VPVATALAKTLSRVPRAARHLKDRFQRQWPAAAEESDQTGLPAPPQHRQ
jgi:hypothetical protein